MRERLIAAATDYAATNGWGSLTMAKIALQVGVSRQTVYNEMGDKESLAQAVVMAELSRFLEAVDDAFTPPPDDICDGIEQGVRGTLELARRSPLLQALLSVNHGATTEVLPFLTTESEQVRAVATERLMGHASSYELPLSNQRVTEIVDLIVRVIISEVMSPEREPEDVAQSLAWIARQVLIVADSSL